MGMFLSFVRRERERDSAANSVPRFDGLACVVVMRAGHVAKARVRGRVEDKPRGQRGAEHESGAEFCESFDSSF
jgi:hypothetical protein